MNDNVESFSMNFFRIENGIKRSSHFCCTKIGLFEHATSYADTLTRLLTRHLPAQNLVKIAYFTEITLQGVERGGALVQS